MNSKNFNRHTYDSQNKNGNYKCIKCGVFKKEIPLTGNGFTIRYKNKFINEYSFNEKDWQRGNIDCKREIEHINN